MFCLYFLYLYILGHILCMEERPIAVNSLGFCQYQNETKHRSLKEMKADCCFYSFGLKHLFFLTFPFLVLDQHLHRRCNEGNIRTVHMFRKFPGHASIVHFHSCVQKIALITTVTMPKELRL